jgi:hypothetical protein
VNAGDTSPLAGYIPLAIAALVVVRFAFRELRLRTVRAPLLWLRPGVLIALLIYLIVTTCLVDAEQSVTMIVLLLVGGVLGVLVGVGIVKNSTFASAGVKGAMRVQGNRITLAIWVAALLVRLGARFVVPIGSSMRAQLPLDCGTVALIAVAFLVIAVAFQREITRFAPTTT